MNEPTQGDWSPYGNSMPVCPHCGHTASCVADLMTQDGVEHGDGGLECNGCGREYAVTLEVIHLFHTRKKDGHD
jgi:transcription elongation factor Elf1